MRLIADITEQEMVATFLRTEIASERFRQKLPAGGVSRATQLYWGDELRIGLLGHVRRRWSPRGMKLRKRVQFGRVWRYLALVVYGIRGQLQ